VAVIVLILFSPSIDHSYLSVLVIDGDYEDNLTFVAVKSLNRPLPLTAASPGVHDRTRSEHTQYILTPNFMLPQFLVANRQKLNFIGRRESSNPRAIARFTRLAYAHSTKSLSVGPTIECEELLRKCQ
jgi:hypothetical protein